MELIPEWAPNIHPMLVHFPVAILSIVILFDFISFFLNEKQKWWTIKATAFLYSVGAVTAVIVYFTGRAAANSVFLSGQAQVVLTNHADWAWWTIWFYGIYALARLAATWKAPKIHRLKLHIAFFVLSFAGLFLLIQTGNRGAKMVFKYGVGVQENQIETPVQDGLSSQTLQSETAPAAFIVSENGNWVWQIESGAVRAMQENFHFLTGSAAGLNTKAVETENGGYALQFSGDKLNGFFVTDKSYQNIQVDYYLDLSAFNGTVFLTYGVQDANSFDFVSVSSNGVIRQGRMANGEPQIFAKDSIDLTEPLFMRVVSSGTHFRGYFNKQMEVHGHGEAPEPGAVGIKIEGSGTILLEQMELTRL